MPARPPSRTFLAHASASGGDAPASCVHTERDDTAATAPTPGEGADVTIDLTGHVPALTIEPTQAPVDTGPSTGESDAQAATPGGPATTPHGRLRRRGVVLVTVVLLSAAVVAAGVASANYTTAMDWKARAEAAEQRATASAAQAAASQRAADEARRARQVAQRHRRQMARQLAVSEADVTTLEARLAALANDRAQAQDVGAVLPALDRGALARTLQAQIDSCVSQVDNVRSGLHDAADPVAWRPAVTAALASCQQAAADLDALVASTP